MRVWVRVWAKEKVSEGRRECVFKRVGKRDKVGERVRENVCMRFSERAIESVSERMRE